MANIVEYSIQLFQKFYQKKQFREFFRFCIVGLICTIIDASIYYLTRIFLPYLAALTCGYCLSLILNYFLTIYWTFEQKANPQNAVGVIGAHLFNLFVVRFSLMYLFVSILGFSDKIAYLPTFAISMITNFLIIRFFVTKVNNKTR